MKRQEIVKKIRADFAKEILDRLDDVANNQPLLAAMIGVIKDHIREVRDKTASR